MILPCPSEGGAFFYRAHAERWRAGFHSAISGSRACPAQRQTCAGILLDGSMKAACPIMMRLALATISSTCASFQSHLSILYLAGSPACVRA